MGYIYIITNKITFKTYIGQTINFAARMRLHKNLTGNKNSLLYEDVKLFSWSNFTIDVVDCPINKLDLMERWFIKHHNTLHPNGYNKTMGGSNGRRSEYTKQKMSQALKKVLSELTPEEKRERYQKISESNKKYYASLSDADKQKYVDKIHNITPSRRQERTTKAMLTLSLKTSEEKEAINIKRSNQLKSTYLNTPKEKYYREVKIYLKQN